jgi:hypothetical protein
VTETVILGIFPWCFTPELYAAKPECIEALAAFVRGRPAEPVDAFMPQTDAVLGHDVESHLSKITSPTQITFGCHDMPPVLRIGFRDNIRGLNSSPSKAALTPPYMRMWMNSTKRLCRSCGGIRGRKTSYCCFHYPRDLLRSRQTTALFMSNGRTLVTLVWGIDL